MSFPFGTILDFHFFIIELKKLDWRTYIKQENPVAAALLSKMGYTKDERIKVKIEFFRILMKLQLDKAREKLLTGFFETYLEFNAEEEQQFLEEVKRLDKKESEKVMEIMTSYEKKGMQIGMEKGIEKGVIKVAKRMIERNKPLEEIVDMTELSIDVVEQLMKEANSSN